MTDDIDRRSFIEVVRLLGNMEEDLASALGYTPASHDVWSMEVATIDRLTRDMHHRGLLIEAHRCGFWATEVMVHQGVVPDNAEVRERTAASMSVLFAATLVHLARHGHLMGVGP